MMADSDEKNLSSIARNDLQLLENKFGQRTTQPTTSVIQGKIAVGHFDKNEIVWAKFGKQWWVGWIEEYDPDRKRYLISYGYDQRPSQAHVSHNQVIPYNSSAEYSLLLQRDQKKKQAKINKTRKMTKIPKKLADALQQADYDVRTWQTVPDHRRHCTCNFLDDGQFMVGCDGCTECWYHPSCLKLGPVSESMKQDPSSIPQFTCVRECDQCELIKREQMRKEQRKRARAEQIREAGRKLKKVKASDQVSVSDSQTEIDEYVSDSATETE